MLWNIWSEKNWNVKTQIVKMSQNYVYNEKCHECVTKCYEHVTKCHKIKMSKMQKIGI